MTISKIASELAPYFRYASKENPSKIYKEWTGSDQQRKTHRVFQNCVSCNTQRLKIKVEGELDLPRGTDTYFCNPCFTNVDAVKKKYENGTPEEKTAVIDAWSKALFDDLQ